MRVVQWFRLQQGARRQPALIDGIVILACAFAVINTAVFTWEHFSSTPFMDFWDWLSDYHTYLAGHYRAEDLIKSHNEHRILTARFLFFIDAIWFHMTGHFVAVVNFMTLILLGLTFGRLYRNRLVICSTASPAIAAAAVMVSLCQWETLLLPFAVQMSILCLSIVAAALFLARATAYENSFQSGLYAAMAGMAFACSAFSMAGGVLALPFLIALLALGRARRNVVLIFLILAACASFCFFYDYHPVTGVDHFVPRNLTGVLAVVKFTAGFLGSAFYPYGTLPFILGYSGLLILSVSGIVLCREIFIRRSQVSYETLALFSVAGTFAIIGGAAAVSRLTKGMSAALEARYAVQSLSFLCAILGLSFQLSLRFGQAPFGRLLAQTRVLPVVLVASAAALNFCPRYRADAQNFSRVMTSQAEAIRQNVFVEPWFNGTSQKTRQQIATLLMMLRSHQLGVFAPYLTTPSPVIASTLSNLTHAGPCRGSIDRFTQLDTTRLLISGWLASPNGKRSADFAGLLRADGSLITIIPESADRPDVSKALHMGGPAHGMSSGFSDPRSSGRGIKVAGLFNGRPDLTCVLKQNLEAGASPLAGIPDAARLY